MQFLKNSETLKNNETRLDQPPKGPLEASFMKKYENSGLEHVYDYLSSNKGSNVSAREKNLWHHPTPIFVLSELDEKI